MTEWEQLRRQIEGLDDGRILSLTRLEVARLLATVDAAEQRVSYAEAERDSARHLHACSGARERTALDTADRLHDALTAERAARERAERAGVIVRLTTQTILCQQAKRERDAARAWSAAWKAAAHNHRQSAHRLIEEQVDVRLERITAERERDEARAQVAALRAATQPFVEVCEALLALPQHAAPVATIIGVGEAKMTPDDVARLRAALATPPAAHVCREPALREALDRIAGQRHVDCCPVETGDEARRIACAALGAAPEEPES